MKVNETITLTREVLSSAGYSVYPVLLENLALIDISTEPPPLDLVGAPAKRHFTFLAVKAAVTAKVQFAEFRRWELPHMHLEEAIEITVDKADAVTAAAAAVAAAAEPAHHVGGWSPFDTPDEEARNVFDKAFQKLSGVRYDPLLVTKQLVSGNMNFIFLTKASLVYPDSAPYSALVRIHGNAKEAAIVKIVPHGSPSPSRFGGYTAFKEVSEEEHGILSRALKGFNGFGFEGKYVSTQLVAGLNYKFAGTQKSTTKSTDKCPAFLTVHAPLSGDPVITGIEKVFDLV
jgi:hypothetical protein